MKKLLFAMLLVALCIGVPLALVAGPVDQVATFVSDTASPAVARAVDVSLPVVEGVRLGVESAIVAKSQAPRESAIGILFMLIAVGIVAFAARRLEYFTMARIQKKPWRHLLNAAQVVTPALRC